MSETQKLLSEDEEFRIIPLNMLAFRDIPRCDLTGARANVQLVTHFNSIYYCTEEMAEHGGRHQKISFSRCPGGPVLHSLPFQQIRLLQVLPL